MKAIIVKNNKFETIGFEVKASGRTLFSWGISSELKSNFQKEIDVNDWITEIFELVRIQERISTESEFIRRFFEVASGQALLKEEKKGVNFQRHDEEMKSLRQKLENIIKNII